MKVRKTKAKASDKFSSNVSMVVKILLMQAIPLVLGIWVAHEVLNEKLHADTEVPKLAEFLINLLYNFKFTPYFAVILILLPLVLLSVKAWFKSLKFNHLIVNTFYTLFAVLFINKIYSFMTLVYIFHFLPQQVPFIEDPNISLVMIPACFLLACVITFLYGKLMNSLKR